MTNRYIISIAVAFFLFIVAGCEYLIIPKGGTMLILFQGGAAYDAHIYYDKKSVSKLTVQPAEMKRVEVDYDGEYKIEYRRTGSVSAEDWKIHVVKISGGTLQDVIITP